MKHVTFKQLKIRNFLSVGEKSVDIDFTPGMHVITGENKDKMDRKNGVGKSTIPDAFFFAIFGRPIRDIKKELVVNNITGGCCSVSLKFNIQSPDDNSNYKIERSLNPSKLFFYKDDVDITRDSIANTTSYILNILEASPDIFKNCVVMTANNTIPFMGQKTIAKRKFIENIFSLEAFSEMLKLVRSDYNEIKKDYDISITQLEEKTSASANYVTQRDKILYNRNIKLEDYKQRYITNKTNIQRHKDELDEITQIDTDVFENTLSEYLIGVDKIENKIRSQLEYCAEIKTDIKRDAEIYNEVGTDKSACPTCLRDITDHDRACIEGDKKNLLNKISEQKKNLINCTDEVEKYKSGKNKLQSAINNIREKINNLQLRASSKPRIQENIEQCNEWIKSLESDIKLLKSTNTDMDSLIDLSTSEISNITVQVEKERDMLNIIDIGKFIVSEEGVKAYIVKQILQIFNSRLAYYLKKMDANCICVFNEYFEEDIINENNKICSYFNFSDGERKNIDLACLFTFADARRMQGNVAYNVSFFDELYDSSLDSRGVELVNDILQDRVNNNNECIFIITHRPEAIKAIANDANIIYLQKESGITTRTSRVEV